ncbi:unnamed protein product, partial [Rotaria sp. Silwood1]
MQTVAIVGAGVSGLISIKCCLDGGLSPTFNTLKEFMAFSNFPPPADYPNYMHNIKLLAYFRMYASKFNFTKYIRFRRRVIRIEQADDYEHTGCWLIYSIHANKEHEKLHSWQYKTSHGLEDKTVLIIGIGSSAGEMAVELGHVAKQVYLSTRRGTWVYNRVGPTGWSVDMYRTNLILATIQKYSPWLMNRLIERELNKKFDHELYSLKSNHYPLRPNKWEDARQLCQKLSKSLIISTLNKTKSISNQCYKIGLCNLILMTNDYHYIKLKQNKNISQLLFSSKFKLLIDYDDYNKQILFSSISNYGTIINTTNVSIKNCYSEKEFIKRNIRQYDRLESTSSIIITFNSSSFIDYHHKDKLNYPLRLSVRFRTLGRISNGVLLSLTYKTITSIIPFIIIEHTNGKIEITILELDQRNALSNVTTVQCGKNVNNDNWHKLQFEIDLNGIFKIIIDDDIRTSQIPTYVITNWNLNALLVGDTRRLTTDIFQPFIGYMSDLIFNNEYLFTSLTTRKQRIQSSFHYSSQHIIVGYRIAFFNLITIETQTSLIVFSERENQNKNHGKLDIYFLFRSYVPDGIILYRYAQGLNEYFAIGLRAGILTLFMDFGFGKRQIVSDESKKLTDGKWHEVRITKIGTD